MSSPNYAAVNALAADPLTTTKDIYKDASTSSTQAMDQASDKNIESARGLLASDSAFENNLGRSDAMSEAIRNRYAPQQGLQERRQRFDNSIENSNRYVDKLRQASALVGQEQDLNYKKAVEVYKAKVARKDGRAAVIGSVLGIVGGVVGGVFGGPAGAAAGYQAGSMIGEGAAGSSKYNTT